MDKTGPSLYFNWYCAVDAVSEKNKQNDMHHYDIWHANKDRDLSPGVMMR